MIPFPQYGPDRAEVDQGFSDAITNVYPTPTGYRPFPTLGVYSDALGGICKGAILARNEDETFTAFAATQTAIYELVGETWTDVSETAVTYTLANGEYWSTTQFGSFVIFTNGNDGPQKYVLGTSTEFEALGGSPPQAKYVGIAGDYLLLMNTIDDPRIVWRSGVNDPEWWVPKSRGSDFQNFPDGGPVVGSIGDQQGAFILQAERLRRLQDAPGSTLLFTTTIVESARGCIAPQSIVQVGNSGFYLAEDGFYRLDLNGSVTIGAERVDRTFLTEDVDPAFLQEVQGAADIVNKSVFWLYTASAGAMRIKGYQWQIDRWFDVATTATFLLQVATAGYTLEQIGALYATLEDVPASLDARSWQGGRPTFGAFDGDDKLGFFNGDNAEAILETADISSGGEGRVGNVGGFRPVGEVSGCYGQLGRKQTFGGERTWSAEAPQNTTGLIPCRGAARLHRFRVRIPEAVEWNHIAGIEPEKETLRSAGRR